MATFGLRTLNDVVASSFRKLLAPLLLQPGMVPMQYSDGSFRGYLKEFPLEAYGAPTNLTDPADDAIDACWADIKANLSGCMTFNRPYLITRAHVFDGLVQTNSPGVYTPGVDLGIRGCGLKSYFTMPQGSTFTCFSFQNMNQLNLEKFAFMSRVAQGGIQDCQCCIRTATNVKTTFCKDLHAYGIKVNTANHGVWEFLGRTVVRDFTLLGCTSMLAGVVECEHSEGLRMENGIVIDHGDFDINGDGAPETIIKTGAQAQQWIRVRSVHDPALIGQPDLSDNMSALKAIALVFRNIAFDEGAKRAIWIDPDVTTYPYGRVMSVIIENCGVNGSVGGAVGFHIKKTDYVRIAYNWIGYASGQAGIAVHLEDVKSADIINVRASDSLMNELRVDALSKHVHLKDSSFDIITAPAGVVTTETEGVFNHAKAHTFNDIRVPANSAPAGYSLQVTDQLTGKVEARARHSGIPTTARSKLVLAYTMEEANGVSKKDKVSQLLGTTGIDLSPPGSSPTQVAGLFGFDQNFVRATSQSLAAPTANNSDPRLQAPIGSWFAGGIAMIATGTGSVTANIMGKYSGAGAFEWLVQRSNVSNRIRFIMNGVTVDATNWAIVENQYFMWMVRYIHDPVTPANQKIGININGLGWIEALHAAGPMALNLATGRFAVGQQGNTATNYWNGILGGWFKGVGETTAQEVLDFFDNGRFSEWPYEIGVGRVYPGEYKAGAALGTKIGSVPEYDPYNPTAIKGYRYLYDTP